jgi:hypothetical protein
MLREVQKLKQKFKLAVIAAFLLARLTVSVVEGLVTGVGKGL